MMSKIIEKRHRCFALTGVISKKDGLEQKPYARNVKTRNQEAEDFAQQSAKKNIGQTVKILDMQKDGNLIGRERKKFLTISAECVFLAVFQIFAFLRSTTLTQQKKLFQRINNIPHQEESSCGLKKLETFKFFAPIATGLRPIKILGKHKIISDITCRRIDESYKQPDFFISPPEKKPVQDDLL